VSGVSLVDSPIGRLAAVSDGLGLTGIRFLNDGDPVPNAPSDVHTREAARQLLAYFARERREFTLTLTPRGTAFQQEVWRALLAIPFGATASYADIAERLGRPKAVRAVGAANGANPLAIVIPCHRIVGRDGTLTGYAGGLERKRTLLAFEAA
jgi:methylated-DNA-[protein]-cysteine S-methyltransferase